MNGPLPIMPQSRSAAVTLHDSDLAARVSIRSLMDYLTSVDNSAAFGLTSSLICFHQQSDDKNYPTNAVVAGADITNTGLISRVGSQLLPTPLSTCQSLTNGMAP